MARDTAGEQFDKRRDEVPTREHIERAIKVRVEEMRQSDKMTPDCASLLVVAARNTPEDLERAALYRRAEDFDNSGWLRIKANNAVDHYIVESVRALVMDTYGPAPDVEDLYVDPLEE